MKPFDDDRAANDEFQSAIGGTHRGELIRGLLYQRVKLPAPVANYQARPELSQRIISHIKPGQVLFLKGPPGYGKSHSVTAALHETDWPRDQLKWLALTGQENEPGRLLALIEVALTASSDSGSSGQKNAASYLDALSMLLSDTALSTAPGSPGGGQQVLVIDNVGVIAHPSSVALLQQLVAGTPQGLSVVLISRKPLLFETHAFELEGRLTTLGSDDLEMTRSETFEFFGEALKTSQLTSIAIEHLYSVTEGWLTPLGLYRRDLNAAPETRLPIQESPSIERFLRDAVQVQLTLGQQCSLRLMAELEIISDELFLALAGSTCDRRFRPSAAAESGIPMGSLPGRGRWFRFNPLLRDWLKTPQMDGFQERALKASRWFRHRGQFPEALRYALISKDPDEALDITSEGSEALLIGQDTASLLRLRQSLPPGLLEQNPRLKIVYGWVHAAGGQFSQARSLIDSLDKPAMGELRGRVDALRAFILRGEGSIDGALEVADRALASSDLPIQGQLVTELVRSSALCAAGTFSEAREANRNAARLARETGDSGSEILAVYAHARIELGKGALRNAEQLLRTGLDTLVNEVARPARVGETRLQLNLVMVLWHQGREAEADRLLVTCIRHAEQTRDLGLLLALALRVLICRTHNQHDEAFTWIGRAERAMQSWKVDSSVYVPVLETLKISGWLASGQIDAAAQSLQHVKPWRDINYVPEMFPMMPGILDCLQARMELARNDDVKAAETLKAIRSKYLETVPLGLELHARLLESVVVRRQKGLTAAQKVLADAIAMASEEHYISPFAELRRELHELVEKTWPQLPASPFVLALGRLYGIHVDTGGQLSLAEPISDRELGVLELIAQGLSNQDIADKLHISLHTVKTHARRINAKLEVRSRTQAIVRARALGLL